VLAEPDSERRSHDEKLALRELLDALAAAGLLLDVAPPWCGLTVTSGKAPTRRTVITLVDLQDGSP
jgi:hypothetical protein